MAKQPKYAVHPDFKSFPVITFHYNKFFMGLVNAFFAFERFLTKRALIRQATTHHVKSSDGHAIKVLQFNPPLTPDNEVLPAVIYLHGGAFVLTYASSHIHICNEYAQRTHCRVFLVDYRLALKNPFPTPFNDCYATLQWVRDNAATLGVDARRIVVTGDSAGGGLAAGMAQRAADEKTPVFAQLLVYPTLDNRCNTPSATDYIDTPMFNAVSNRGMWQTYLRHSGATAPAYAAPGTRKDLSEQPTTYIETAEFDPLRDEAAQYAQRLTEAGVKVTLHQPKGTVHGYDAILKSAISQDSIERRMVFLRGLFEKK